MTVPRNALAAAYQTEATLGVQGTAGSIILQHGGLQSPVAGLFGLTAQLGQQMTAQSMAAELLPHIDAHLSYAAVAPARVYPVQCGPPGNDIVHQQHQPTVLCVGGIPRSVWGTGSLKGGMFCGDAL